MYYIMSTLGAILQIIGLLYCYSLAYYSSLHLPIFVR